MDNRNFNLGNNSVRKRENVGLNRSVIYTHFPLSHPHFYLSFFNSIAKKNCSYSVLTPRSRVLLEKLTAFQLVKKFPAFYRNGRFIIAFTSSHHLSLS